MTHIIESLSQIAIRKSIPFILTTVTGLNILCGPASKPCDTTEQYYAGARRCGTMKVDDGLTQVLTQVPQPLIQQVPKLWS